MTPRVSTALAVVVVLLVAVQIGVAVWARHGARDRAGVPASAAELDREASAEPRGFVPAGGDAIDDLLASVRVGHGVSHGGLTVFPVTVEKSISDFLPVTLDEAIQTGDLVVKEIGSGEVNRVRVKNTGRRAVFIVSGDIMTGSKQDRTARHDVLVPAESGWIEVPVYCLEEGRWTAVGEQFETRRSLAAPALRLHAYQGEPQHRIWEEVDRAARDNQVAQGETKAYQHIYEDRAVRRRLDEAVSGLRLPADPRMVGLVCFLGDRPLGADLFSNAALFGELKEKLLRSYALSPARPGHAVGPRVTPEQAARYLARAWSPDCRRIPIETPGIGRAMELRNARWQTGGGALVYGEETVHLALFPDVDAGDPAPIPVPRPIPVPGPSPGRTE